MSQVQRFGMPLNNKEGFHSSGCWSRRYKRYNAIGYFFQAILPPAGIRMSDVWLYGSLRLAEGRGCLQLAKASTFSAVKQMARAGTSALGAASVKRAGLCKQQVLPSLILNDRVTA